MQSGIFKILVLVMVFVSSLANGQNNKHKKRIITAGSAITEIVCMLGFEDQIIATDRTSVYPTTMMQLPSIGYRNGINAENIIAQGPDMILAEKGYVKEEVLAQLTSTNIEFHALIDPLSFEGTKLLIRNIGDILQVKKKAEALITKMEKDWNSLRTRLSKTTSKPKIVFVLSHSPGTQMVAGTETFANALIEMAHAKNGISMLQGFKPLNAEAMIVANPDFLLFGNRAFNGIGKHEGASKIPGVKQTKAGKKQQFISLDLVMISNFGPRLIQAVEALALAIHPELQENLSQNE